MRKFLSISMFLVGFCLCVSCGYLFSTLVLQSGILQSTTAAVEQQKFFVLCVQDQVDAKALQSENGAGFVWNDGEKSHLVASVYENRSDAQHVNEKLFSNEGEILEYTLPKQEIDRRLSENEMQIAIQCLKAPVQTYKKLYDIAVSLDTNVSDLNEAKLQCNVLYSSHIAVKTNFETFLADKKLTKLQESITKIENALSDLISEKYENENQTFSSLVKLTYCNILFF